MKFLTILLLLISLSFSNCMIYSESLGTGSMGANRYVKGEEIQIDICVPFSQIEVGDIIVFKANLGKAFESRYENNTIDIYYNADLTKWKNILKTSNVIHRVIAKFDGRKMPYSDFYPQQEFLVTKGDANPAPDFFFTTYYNYIGKAPQRDDDKQAWKNGWFSKDFKAR